MCSSEATTPPEKSDRWLGLMIYLSLALCFAPLFQWLGGAVQAEAQLSQSLLVFTAAIGLVIYLDRLPWTPTFRFERLNLGLLFGTFALISLAVLSSASFALIPAVALSIASAAHFALGKSWQRLVLAAAASLGLFLVIALLLPAFDWPLRIFAGRGSAAVLSACGQTVELGVSGVRREPHLLLFNNGRPFHVAPECNGYGLLATSVLVALFLVLYKPLSLLQRIGLVALGIVLAYIGNVLRIVVIVFLAPVVGADNYDFMHETVGVIFFYGSLSLTGWLILRVAERHRLKSTRPESTLVA